MRIEIEMKATVLHPVYGRLEAGTKRAVDKETADSLAGKRLAVVVGQSKDVKWKMRITPEDYLRRHPEGPNAELAEEIIRGEGGEFSYDDAP